jgi:hypothetical protein
MCKALVQSLAPIIKQTKENTPQKQKFLLSCKDMESKPITIKPIVIRFRLKMQMNCGVVQMFTHPLSFAVCYKELSRQVFFWFGKNKPFK